MSGQTETETVKLTVGERAFFLAGIHHGSAQAMRKAAADLQRNRRLYAEQLVKTYGPEEAKKLEGFLKVLDDTSAGIEAEATRLFKESAARMVDAAKLSGSTFRLRSKVSRAFEKALHELTS